MKITTQHLIIPLAKVTMLGDLLSLQLHRTKFVTHQGHLYMSQYRKQHLPYQAKLQIFLLDPKFNINKHKTKIIHEAAVRDDA